MNDKLWLTADEVAKIEGITTDGIIKRIRRGKYPPSLVKKIARDVGGYKYLLHSSMFIDKSMIVKALNLNYSKKLK